MSAPEHMKEGPYTTHMRHSESAPLTVKSKRDDKKFREGRVESTFDAAEDMLHKLGPHKDWSGMPHTPEKKDNVLLTLPKLM
jgi:hypothetical protein